MKNIQEEIKKLNDRELMEKQLEYQYKSEKHLQFISNVIVVSIFIAVIIVGIVIINASK